MRAVIQRVQWARVRVEGRLVGEISAGILVLLGIRKGDSAEASDYLAGKIAHLRIFPDEDGKMNRSIVESRGSALVVSQFTLYGDTRGGRRPSYVQAAPSEEAAPLYEEFNQRLRATGIAVEKGVFQAHMEVELLNDGPVTIVLDSEKSI